jgi:RNA polymerase sigma-70 factor (ECF subfamily)
MDNNSSATLLPDEELVARASAGSRAAFEELVARYTPRLFFFLRRKSGSDDVDVEDLIQETFVRAFRNIDRYDTRWKFSTWLYTMAVRIAISRYRSQKTKLVGLDPKNPEDASPVPWSY